jgi:hypothetical protein
VSRILEAAKCANHVFGEEEMEALCGITCAK